MYFQNTISNEVYTAMYNSVYTKIISKKQKGFWNFIKSIGKILSSVSLKIKILPTCQVSDFSKYPGVMVQCKSDRVIVGGKKNFQIWKIITARNFDTIGRILK